MNLIELDGRLGDGDHLEWRLRPDIQALYPLTETAKSFGMGYVDVSKSEAFSYISMLSPLGIHADSFLDKLLQLPFMKRLQDVRQLGPNYNFPYPYNHTIFDHTTEQLVRGITRLAFLAETQRDLFSQGTRIFRKTDLMTSEDLDFVLKVAAITILMHDAESLPLRDTSKFAFKVAGCETDENIRLVQRLKNYKDKKYNPYLKEIFGDKFSLAKKIICEIILRKNKTFIGDFLHSRPLPDSGDNSGSSRPLDLDRITYTLQDLLCVFGPYFFDFEKFANELTENALCFEDIRFLIENPRYWNETDRSSHLYTKEKVNPCFLDLIPHAVLAHNKEGNIVLAYEDVSKLYRFLHLASLGNFPSLYLTPALIFTEKEFEKKIRSHFITWNYQKRHQFLEKMSNWTDKQFVMWLGIHWPDAVLEIQDEAYQKYVYEGFYTLEDSGLITTQHSLFVPVKIHPATSTLTLDVSGQVCSIADSNPQAVKELHDTLALYSGKKLVINRYPKSEDIINL